jgi:hypothetical protein
MLLEVVSFQTFASQQCINRWNYQSNQSDTVAGQSVALVNALFGPVSGDPLVFDSVSVGYYLQLLQSLGVRFDAVSARAVYADADFYELVYAVNITGQVSGEAQSPSQAYGFRSDRVLQSIRRGTKRFVGVTDTLLDQNGVVNSAGVALMEDVAFEMSQNITVSIGGVSTTFTPCVVQKEVFVPEGKAYKSSRYYLDPAVQLEHTALGVTWQAYPTVRTQVSRQYGRGR